MGERSARFRFMEKVQLDKCGCWFWAGAIAQGRGYGVFHYQARYCRAHRASYMLFIGPIPSDLCVLHKCNNRDCVNPDHLYAGTNKDNARDRDIDGNTARGEKHGASKITNAMRDEIAKDITTPTDVLGLKYGIDRSRIGKIRKHWRVGDVRATR